MKIAFEQMAEEVQPRFKGGEGCLRVRTYFDGTNKIMRGVLEPGSSIGYHRHEGNSETIFLLSGEGRCLYDGGEERLRAGECHYCPPGHSHSLINASATEPLEYLAVVPEHA